MILSYINHKIENWRYYMISPSECAELLGLTDTRIKQIFKEIVPESEIVRTKAENGKIRITPTQVRRLIESRNSSYVHTIATFGNEKGGVGKSLITINVAIRRAQLGARVLIIDLDPEACATNFLIRDEDFDKDCFTMLEVFKDNMLFKDAIIPTKYEFLDIVPCRGKSRRAERYVRDENLGSLIKSRLKGLSEIYDLILFEVPPTFSNIIASAYAASDIVVIPTFPDTWSLESVLLTIEDIKEMSEKWQTKAPEIKVILNKYRVDRLASQEAWETMTKEMGNYLLPFQIKESADLQNSINSGKSLFESHAPKSIKDSFGMLADLVSPLNTKKKNVIH